MIDIRVLRDDPDAVKAALARRGVEAAEVDAVMEADRAWSARLRVAEAMRAEVKELSRLVGQAKKAGDETRAAELSRRSRRLGDDERVAAAEAEAYLEQRETALLYLPNIPADDAPDGVGEEDNVEVRRWWPGQGAGRPEPGRAAHQEVPHWEIGESLQILDMERGARLAGSMFPLYRGPGARLLRALTAFALDRHAPAYEEVRPPTVVLTETMTSTGHLPKFADDAYHLERDDLWLIPTAEVPLTSMHRGEILEESQLPLRFTAATACYRREAGSAGRDTRGLLRVHEFDKVELFAYTTPGEALEAQADILQRAESMLQELELPYRVLDLCCADLGGVVGAHLRPGGLRARRRPLARGELGQLVPRLPGPPGQRALPPRRGRLAATGAHGQRLGAGLAAHLGRPGGERAPAGRDRAAARVPGAVSRRGTADQGAMRPAPTLSVRAFGPVVPLAVTAAVVVVGCRWPVAAAPAVVSETISSVVDSLTRRPRSEGPGATPLAA